VCSTDLFVFEDSDMMKQADGAQVALFLGCLAWRFGFGIYNVTIEHKLNLDWVCVFECRIELVVFD
jgi:hypothetical protein